MRSGRHGDPTSPALELASSELASPGAVRRQGTWAAPEAGPAPAGWPRPARFGSRLAREEVLFLRADTPFSLGFTRKRGFRSPVKLPHPLWGVPNELFPPFIPMLISPTSHHPTFPDAGHPLLSSRHAQRAWPGPGNTRPPPATRAAAGPEPRALLRPGKGRTGREVRQATPRGGGPRLRGWGPPSVQPCGSRRSTTHLLGMAGRCSARGPRGGGGLLARLRHGKAAANTASGRAQRRLEGRPGRGALGGREGAEGPEGAPVRQLFRPSPKPARGLLLARSGPPLPARGWLLFAL